MKPIKAPKTLLCIAKIYLFNDWTDTKCTDYHFCSFRGVRLTLTQIKWALNGFEYLITSLYADASLSGRPDLQVMDQSDGGHGHCHAERQGGSPAVTTVSITAFIAFIAFAFAFTLTLTFSCNNNKGMALHWRHVSVMASQITGNWSPSQCKGHLSQVWGFPC